MNRVSWRDPWSIQIKQRHWLVIFQWDPWLVYINETTFIHHFYGKQLFFVTVSLTYMFICLRFSVFSYFDLKRLQRSEEIKDNLGTKFPNAISLRLKRKIRHLCNRLQNCAMSRPIYSPQSTSWCLGYFPWCIASKLFNDSIMSLARWVCCLEL